MPSASKACQQLVKHVSKEQNVSKEHLAVRVGARTCGAVVVVRPRCIPARKNLRLPAWILPEDFVQSVEMKVKSGQYV